MSGLVVAWILVTAALVNLRIPAKLFFTSRTIRRDASTLFFKHIQAILTAASGRRDSNRKGCILRTEKEKESFKLVSSVLKVPFGILLTLVIGAYMFARFFLVIESFISLRSVPLGVYTTLDWTNYFPHF